MYQLSSYSNPNLGNRHLYDSNACTSRSAVMRLSVRRRCGILEGSYSTSDSRMRLGLCGNAAMPSGTRLQHANIHMLQLLRQERHHQASRIDRQPVRRSSKDTQKQAAASYLKCYSPIKRQCNTTARTYRFPVQFNVSLEQWGELREVSQCDAACTATSSRQTYNSCASS